MDEISWIGFFFRKELIWGCVDGFVDGRWVLVWIGYVIGFDYVSVVVMVWYVGLIWIFRFDLMGVWECVFVIFYDVWFFCL